MCNKMNFFTIVDNKEISTTDIDYFINHWAERYYNYTSISDSVYNEIKMCFREERDLNRAVQLLGAWKTNSFSLKEKESIAFKCNTPGCEGRYYFSGLWKPGTSSAYKIWRALARDFQLHKDILDRGHIIQLINELMAKEYIGSKSPNTKFGYIYSITYLHFLNDKYPILDVFVYRALKFIYSEIRPNIPFTIKNEIKTPQQYIYIFIPLFNQFANEYSGPNRNVDKALWAFGHYVYGSKKIKIPCCRI